MKIKNSLMSMAVVLTLAGCGPATYNGKVDLVGVGAGPKPTRTDRHYIDPAKVPNSHLLYADKIQEKEQDVSTTVKYVVGDALIKEYSGEPQLLVDYLNAHQKLDNLVLILDKNGVVAWSSHFRTSNIADTIGIYDYGLMGEDRMSFSEAMEKFVGDLDEAEDYKPEKKIFIPKDNTDTFMSGFSRDKKYPFLFTKLNELKDAEFTNIDGQKVKLSSLINDNKPTILIFYKSKAAKDEASLQKDIDMAKDVFNMLKGGSTSSNSVPAPQIILQNVETTIFK